MRTIYRANDGEEFSNAEKAIEHEFSNLVKWVKSAPKDLSGTPEFDQWAIQNPEHFIEAVQFASTAPKETMESFVNCCKILNNFNSPVTIVPDFVKHSFIFNAGGLQGGFILHGYQETFSVEVDPPKHPHWSLHT